MGGKTAVIIGAGPAGLTATFELLEKTDIKPIIYEATADIGGISKTVNYKGNRIDIGGHRFFSKSDRVNEWWLKVLPMQTAPALDDLLLGRQALYNKNIRSIAERDPEKCDKVMLIRSRLSRIFYLRQFFNYPISMSIQTLSNLGLLRVIRIGISYILSSFFPIRNEKSLEDFFINRFGRELYQTFFKDYTEKVWGVPCQSIPSEWGAQRIKGLSIRKAVAHALNKILSYSKSVEQHSIETSLIERFMYPKFGPGQLWEEVADRIINQGGQIHLQQKVVKLAWENDTTCRVSIRNEKTGDIQYIKADYVISTMPIRDLIEAMGNSVPTKVKQVAKGLVYRDFITVGLLLKKIKIYNETSNKTVNNIIPDNWIYIQERDVKVGRLQVFNNWSPYMVNNPNTIWLGLEYFCNEGDSLWAQSNKEFTRFAIAEMVKIGMIDEEDVLDSTVIKMPKAYPAYFGTYDELDKIKEYVSSFKNLYLIGRNGMHRYNNMDHSMLTAMLAVESIVAGDSKKEEVWSVNTEEYYHEKK